MRLSLVPVTLREANAFVVEHHRHNKPDRGWKFGVGLKDDAGRLVGIAIAGRPKARALDDGVTIEVTRTCTDGSKNANSMLYGAIWRAARSLGYTRGFTYTQADEPGSSLKASGWKVDAELPARSSWAESSVKLRDLRDPVGNGGVERVRWIVTTA